MRRSFLLPLSWALIVAMVVDLSVAECPFARRLRAAPKHHHHQKAPAATATVGASSSSSSSTNGDGDIQAWREAVEKLDWSSVKEDLKATLTTSQEWWPADYGHYGPLMIRLAWHCAGSYRSSDGLGGCDGARQRFDPERSWDDNTNLDKARKLLEPIKDKYGVGLSWGDLIVLAGNVAIESMGGPVLGFCAGRIDDKDGSDSELLGPTAEQELRLPCEINGQCTTPLGASTIGLIYVNPEGPMNVPDPKLSAPDIREVFGRMSMNDSETVALIGGGHAFGKTHGACPLGAGPSPMLQEDNPWPGMCATGKGADAFTSGFEGKWTPTPTEWGNSYFTALVNNDWEVVMGPGDRHQWKPVGDNPDDITMLTTDVALLHDPQGEYQKLVELFANDQDALNTAFAHSWYKLTTRDMGPVTRCLGPDVPPAQPFQNPLPPPPAKLADFESVKKAIKKAMAPTDAAASKKNAASSSSMADTRDGKPYYGALFIQLAHQCASTFRSSDYQGGCNGARIRFSPEKDWPNNVGMDAALEVLEPVKKQFGNSLSWADLIVLAGNVGLEEASGGNKFSFCGGRSDATDGQASRTLPPMDSYAMTDSWEFTWRAKMLGMETRELVALQAMPRSKSHMARLGYGGIWSNTTTKLDNTYFTTLLEEEWEEGVDPAQAEQEQRRSFKAKEKDLFMVPTDVLIKTDPDLKAVAQEYAQDNQVFLQDFTTAWTKLMNADRFDGPGLNVCDQAKSKKAH